MQIKASQEAVYNLPKLDRFVELMRQKLTTLDYETKRIALDMLGIKVWIDGHNVEITGTLPITDDVIVTTQSCCNYLPSMLELKIAIQFIIFIS